MTVSLALSMPANATAPRLTGHTTGTADSTGFIVVSDLVVVAEPGDYILAVTLTDFPLVCPLASCTCSYYVNTT